MIGSIVERSSKPRLPVPPSQNIPISNTGFPSAQHRSKKSAFARARAQESSQTGTLTNNEEWLDQTDRENMKTIDAMTDEERDVARQDILARFGPGLGDVLRRNRERRGKAPQKAKDNGFRTHSDEATISQNDDAKLSKRQLRFADVKPSDVYVYESQPSSPKRAPIALLPPPPFTTQDELDGVKTTKLSWKPSSSIQMGSASESPHEEEGTPGDIRKRFFPSAREDDPAIAWITSPPSSDPIDAVAPVRYDLTGNPIPIHISESLPTHLGLHHHSGENAGYTIDELLLLSRSTVLAQRSMMLDVLARILHGLHARAAESSEPSNIDSELLRGRIVAAGIDAVDGTGILALRGAQILWEGIVNWEGGSIFMQPHCTVEFSGPARPAPSDFHSDFISSPISTNFIAQLPMPHILSLVAGHFTDQTLPPSTLLQLLQVVHRVCLQSCANCEDVIKTPRLLHSILRCFLLSPPDTEDPQPLAVHIFTVLAESSREAAASLIEAGVPDSFLRFVALLPSGPLSQKTLIQQVLEHYTVLAKYGLYTGVASSAASLFHSLSSFLLSAITSDPTSHVTSLAVAWCRLIEVWIVCAEDPHSTTPAHSILWSQVVAWDWLKDLLELHDACAVHHTTELASPIWVAILNALSAWLAGASVNSVRGGERERATIISSLMDFGPERVLSHQALGGLVSETASNIITPTLMAWVVRVSDYAATLHAVLRLLSTLSDSLPKDVSPAASAIQDACQGLVQHPMWSEVLQQTNIPYLYASLRPITSLLVINLKIMRASDPANIKNWLNAAFQVLNRLLPGEENSAAWIFQEIASLIDSEMIHEFLSNTLPDPGDLHPIIITVPFLHFACLPQNSQATGKESPDLTIIVSPAVPTAKLIPSVSRQMLPSSSFLRQPSRAYGLPLPPDWPFSPLNELFRSGTSEVFTTLGPDWNSSEIDLVRATFWLALVMKNSLGASCSFGHDEALLACMKVFMLEHNQKQEDSAEEVFRDEAVQSSMISLLNITKSNSPSRHSSLEEAAIRFLGHSTPFFQFYSDFLALYDSISFSDPLFGSLLLPPLAMGFPADYRKLLWVDHPHILRTLNIEPTNPSVATINTYLWPVESGGDLLAAYAGALCNGVLFGMMRLIALHHTACHIWPDVWIDADSPLDDRNPQGRRLLSIIVGQAPDDVLRDIVLYRQQQSTPLLPPKCFVDGGLSWKRARLLRVEDWGMGDKVGRLLKC